MFRAGQVVAGYRIHRLLGTGGMGSVYLADNPTLPRRDALKVLSAELSRNADFRARFIREAEVAAGLDHPNIVSVYNRGQTADGQLWIAMQFVDGTDAEAAQRGAGMSPQRAVQVITDVAKALDYAHTRGVIHRDVKPANFMLTEDSGEERALLGDFGIARALDDVGLTATGSVLATVAYAAPEVLSGQPLDGRADIYSLGCALFALLAGRTPFASANGMAAVMMAHLNQPAPKITDLAPHLPPAFDAVIAVAMAKDPGLRFATATALAQAAAAALSNQMPTGFGFSAPRPVVDSGSFTQANFTRAAIGSSPASFGSQTVGSGPVRAKKRTLALAAGAAASLVVFGSVFVVTTTNSHRSDGATLAPATVPRPKLSHSEAASTIPLAAGPDTPAESGKARTDVRPDELKAILLSPAQLRGSNGEHDLVLEGEATTLLDDAPIVTPADCVGAWSVAQDRSYSAHIQTGVVVQALRAMNRRLTEEGVLQAVLSFPTRMDAVQSLMGQQRVWQGCANRSITASTPGGAPQVWDIGASEVFTGTVTSVARLQGGTAVCQHGITVLGNVLIDIRQCLPRGGNDVSALVTATGDRVPLA